MMMMRSPPLLAAATFLLLLVVPTLAFVVAPPPAATMSPTISTTTCRSREQHHPQHKVGTTTTTTRTAASTTDDDTAATTTDRPTPIILNGVNIDLTPALEAHVEKRIGKTLSKLASNGAVRECDVVLSVSKNPKAKNSRHLVEIVTNVKGTTIICKNASPDMYESIDAAAHALQRKLRKYKERRTEGWHGSNSKGGELRGDDDDALWEALEAATAPVDGDDAPPSLDDDDDDAFVDPYNTSVVTKVKSFQLDHPVTVEEAVFSLDYVDHDFYVFRNKDTNKINVVYKLHTGGVGHVEP